MSSIGSSPSFSLRFVLRFSPDSETVFSLSSLHDFEKGLFLLPAPHPPHPNFPCPWPKYLFYRRLNPKPLLQSIPVLLYPPLGRSSFRPGHVSVYRFFGPDTTIVDRPSSPVTVYSNFLLRPESVPPDLAVRFLTFVLVWELEPYTVLIIRRDIFHTVTSSVRNNSEWSSDNLNRDNLWTYTRLCV